MHWKLKAAIQNAVALLPAPASRASYYWIQRHFGALRRLDPMKRLAAGIETWRRAAGHGRNPSGKTFLEIGTGRVPLVPLAFWLMGAERTVTLDKNPYLKGDLIAETVRSMLANAGQVRGLFGTLLDEQRFDRLREIGSGARFRTEAFLDLCGIDYVAPGDGADTRLPDRSVDFHTSCSVFEHIPPEELGRILIEGNRIVRTDGLFVHRIDYSDHFSHSDRSISAINFLRYTDEEWAHFAGNRYMYMNRLRHDDFMNLFRAAGHRVLEANTEIDAEARALLVAGGLVPDRRFSGKSEEILATTGSWIVSAKI